jgi:hypothetical protein
MGGYYWPISGIYWLSFPNKVYGVSYRKTQTAETRVNVYPKCAECAGINRRGIEDERASHGKE